MPGPRITISGHLQAIESTINDPQEGLPEVVFLFVTRHTPMINVDLLIRDAEGRVLLTWRDDGYEHSPGWHIPGGIIRYKESRAERVQTVARKELGTSVRFREEPLAIREVIHPTRRDRGHFISLLYLCELAGPLDDTLRFQGGNPLDGQWAWHEEAPPDLIPVHDMYRAFLPKKLPVVGPQG